VKRSDLKQDPRNARRHGELSQGAIRRSVEALGAGRSILVDRDGVVIAGNGVLEQAQAIGLKLKLVHTDGDELIAVRRTDLETYDPRRTALAIADNAVAELSDWDNPTLDEIRAEIGPALEEVSGFGLDSAEEDCEPPPPDDPTDFDTCDKYGAVLRMGDYRADVTREDYDRVIEAIRQAVGFDEDAILAELLRRIGA
jgi:hypothetical protein